jgi:hypothetical protein
MISSELLLQRLVGSPLKVLRWYGHDRLLRVGLSGHGEAAVNSRRSAQREKSFRRCADRVPFAKLARDSLVPSELSAEIGTLLRSNRNQYRE